MHSGALPTAKKEARRFHFKALPERIGRFLFGDDIFISYSRQDGSKYALALARKLAKYQCYLDQLGTTPGQKIPRRLKRKVRRSSIFVLVATQAAVRSAAVEEEVVLFLQTGRP